MQYNYSIFSGTPLSDISNMVRLRPPPPPGHATAGGLTAASTGQTDRGTMAGGPTTIPGGLTA
jgi:hypothetical protein